LRRHSGGSGKSSVVARARAADVAQP
jgi:hypothetical protein